jgi:hypothetical protein
MTNIILILKLITAFAFKVYILYSKTITFVDIDRNMKEFIQTVMSN